MKAFTKKIVLENGREFYGYGFGADREAINEIVFNTSMVGYQEIMSDPSYTDQMVVMTYPLIGNYGMADEDYETKTPTIGGMIVREYNDSPSNFRYTKTLNEVFEEHDIPAIWGVDTRALTRIIRDEGSQKVLITDKRFHVEKDKCVKCGICANVCPVGDIKGGHGEYPEWLHHKDCLTCFTCYHHCPHHAIEFGHQTQKKGQYFYK